MSSIVAAIKSTPAPVPNPPSQLRVIEQTAYRINQNWGNWRKERVGTIALGSLCDEKPGNGTNDGYFIVDRKAVKLDPGKSRPNAPVAKCG